MRTVTVFIAALVLVVFAVGPMPCQGQRVLPTPPESLGGLTPGVSFLADALRDYSAYDVALPGEAEAFAGGSPATKAYIWSPGVFLNRRGLTVETPINAPVITTIMVDMYPGVATSRGLSALTSEDRVRELYGMPDYAFDHVIFSPPVRELYYLDLGLLIVLDHIPGRPNWTVTKIILTYPTYLRSAVSQRMQETLTTHRVEDSTSFYRVWARISQLTPQLPSP